MLDITKLSLSPAIENCFRLPALYHLEDFDSTALPCMGAHILRKGRVFSGPTTVFIARESDTWFMWFVSCLTTEMAWGKFFPIFRVLLSSSGFFSLCSIAISVDFYYNLFKSCWYSRRIIFSDLYIVALKFTCTLLKFILNPTYF